jgi:hypothetical protein
MTTTEPAVTLVHLPAGQPIDLFSALGDLLAAALHGAMLAPGSHGSVNAEVRLPSGMNTREAADRLRHAAAAVRGVEYVPQPRPDDEPELTTGHMRLDDTGVSFGMGGPREVYEQAAINLIDAFRPALDRDDAPNYVQFEAEDPRTRDGGLPTTGERYALIVCRPGGKTPHQLRREAEAEAERLRAAIERVRELCENPSAWGYIDGPSSEDVLKALGGRQP